METTEFSETSVSKNLTPGKYPKESNLQLDIVNTFTSFLTDVVPSILAECL
jgi:hypothetical protein